MSSKDVVDEFCSSLCDLTVNSKPHINMLTMLAEDYIQHAPALVQAVEDQLKHVSGEVKLPVLYLIDSIVKNVGETYITLFSKNIANTFTHAFERVDEKARSQMYKLRSTWHTVFPPSKMYALDTKVNGVDPAWPITAVPSSSSIHVNPKFLNNPPSTQIPLNIVSPDNQHELLKQQKELLDLQKRKVELELMQTKAKLEEQTKRSNATAASKVVGKKKPVTSSKSKKSNSTEPAAPPLKPAAPAKIRDPRLRVKDKDATKDDPPKAPEVKSPPRAVLSPVPSPANSQQSGSSADPSPKSKKDKKSKKHKESRSSKHKNTDDKKSGEGKPEKIPKLTRAEEVLKNLEEEQRLSKIQKLGSEAVINKAKQHEQMLQPKTTRTKDATKRKREPTPPPPPPAVVEESVKRKTPTPPPAPTLDIQDPENPPPAILPDPEALVDSGQDTDLRLLTAKNIDLESSPAKKAKTEILDDLFGKEDVDLRALPPPAPIISRPSPSRSPEKQKSWANFKRTNSETSPETPKPYAKERKRSNRFVNNEEANISDDEPSFDDPAYEEVTQERMDMMFKDAAQQLSSGALSFVQYNYLLKEMITKNEKKKLDEAIRREDAEEYDYDNGKSPSPESDGPEQKNPPVNVFNKRRKFGDRQPPQDEEKRPYEETPAPLQPGFPAREERVRRFPRDRPSRFDRSFPPTKGPWVGGNQQMQPPVRGVNQPRDKFGRWPPMMGSARPPFEGGKPANFRFSQPIGNNFGGMMPPNREVPPADPSVLEMIAKDTMKTINIDSIPREIRFYGETAVIMMAWDDPRELNFQPGQRRVTFNERETFLLNFNSPYREIYVDGMCCQIRLGAPTRELFIDGMFYEGIFGGPPIQVRVGNVMHSVRLSGPHPNVRIGNEPRNDLVAGKVNLIVDANDIFSIYLDAKPQRFDIGGMPYILRFVEALQVVVINGVPFNIKFGSNLPVPMYFNGEKHYLRFSALPKGIRPGYLTIINMEGGRLPSPPPLLPPPPLMVPNNDQTNMLPPAHMAIPPDVSMTTQDVHHQVNDTAPVMPDHHHAPQLQSEQKPLELLASLMPTAFTPGIGQSYTVEENSNHLPDTPSAQSSTTNTVPSTLDLSSNVRELLRKLEAVGIVPSATKNEDKSEEVTTEIVPVSFDRPESLKTRQPGLVHSLYSGMQCSSCGVRFPPEQTGKYSQHLDWHFRQNRRERDAMRVAQSRRWNYDVSDWIQYQEIEEKEDRAQSWFEIQEKRSFETEETTDEDHSVPAGEKGENACCEICKDKFDQFYNDEKEEWHLKRAIEVDGKLYHPLCHKDREEKLLNPVEETETPEMDKSVLLVPTEEPETIEIPDDTMNSEDATEVEPEPIVSKEVEKVETIDLDSEQSNSKDGQVGEIEEPEEPKKEDEEVIVEEKEEIPVEDPESDDDILQIEVLENKFETYELSDEEDFPEGETADPIDSKYLKKDKDQSGDECMEVDLSKVKEEKVEIVDLDAQIAQPTVVSTIDGNVELDDAAPVSLPKKIVINIPSARPIRPASSEPDPPGATDDEAIVVTPKALVPFSEQVQSGEKLLPKSIKPRIAEIELDVLPPVSKDVELSGLCSIM